LQAHATGNCLSEEELACNTSNTGNGNEGDAGMLLEEEFDADEILRDKDAEPDDIEPDAEEMNEIDFEGAKSEGYDDIVNDLDQAGDLWE
jgi:hypothetical protein